jgi:4-amino-4-deoxy-L-arabinose transferase-like glycosyltransferase
MPPALVASFAFAVLPRTWGRWSDVLVDFGQQLYVPWRLSRGDVLYRDVAYLHGPLSQYVNAALFRLFGAGYWTLALFNLVLTALLVALLYRLFARLGGALSATAAALFFIAVFAFGQPLGMGNYDYVTPYVHEITHGVLLGLLGLFALARLDESARPSWAAAAGLALGLGFLTKAETFVAALLATATYVVLVRRRVSRRALALLFLGGVAPPVLAFLLFATAMPGREAFLAVLGPFRPHVLFGGAAQNVFFLSKMGLTHPASVLGATAIVAFAYAAILGAALLVARGSLARARGAPLVAAVAAGIAAGLVVVRFSALGFSLPFPLVAVLSAAVAARRLHGADESDARRERLRLAFSVFALALLPKILLACLAVHYGFVLAMPATLLALDAGLTLLPARAGSTPLVRGAVLAVAAVVAADFLLLTSGAAAGKVVPVGTGRDRFLADARGVYVDAALAELARFARPGDTLATVPEGATLNYLARLRNPTPYTNLMPTEVTSFGEDAILASFRAHPPDLVAVVHKSTAEYGLPFFGRDYARSLRAFLEERYDVVSQIGAPPLVDERFGIAILRRKDR